ncbi:MAG TPA: DUF1732 domain-containing protein, partial [Candidatus Cloacimonadota bacterium]|nr:DUF1732 domain-containing protein [Candidatus Cloacimonadota bacterium]
MKSMTGYGKSNLTFEDIDLDIEIKSVNSRFFDLKLYLPRELSFLEIELRNIIRQTIKRAYIEARISIRDRRIPKIEIDENKLLTYWNLFQKVREVVGSNQNISLEKVLDEPGVVTTDNTNLDTDEFRKIFMTCLASALDQQEKMAQSEGLSMKNALVESLQKIKISSSNVYNAFENYKSTLFEKYKARILELLNDHITEENEKRLLMETAIYIDKADIHEELTRLDDHILKFQELLDKGSDDELGKTMNFIVQEMHREGNTLG